MCPQCRAERSRYLPLSMNGAFPDVTVTHDASGADTAPDRHSCSPSTLRWKQSGGSSSSSAWRTRKASSPNNSHKRGSSDQSVQLTWPEAQTSGRSFWMVMARSDFSGLQSSPIQTFPQILRISWRLLWAAGFELSNFPEILTLRNVCYLLFVVCCVVALEQLILSGVSFHTRSWWKHLLIINWRTCGLFFSPKNNEVYQSKLKFNHFNICDQLNWIKVENDDWSLSFGFCSHMFFAFGEKNIYFFLSEWI